MLELMLLSNEQIASASVGGTMEAKSWKNGTVLSETKFVRIAMEV